jgi:hypothetical protein
VKQPLSLMLAFIVGALVGAGALTVLAPTIVGAQPSRLSPAQLPPAQLPPAQLPPAQLPPATSFKAASGFSWGTYMVLIGDDGTSRICLANSHTGLPLINKCEQIPY